MGTLSGVNRGASSYFNKNGGGVNVALPNIGSSGGGINKNSAVGNYRGKDGPSNIYGGYKAGGYGGLSGGLGGGIGGGIGGSLGGGIGSNIGLSDPYGQNTNY